MPIKFWSIPFKFWSIPEFTRIKIEVFCFKMYIIIQSIKKR